MALKNYLNELVPDFPAEHAASLRTLIFLNFGLYLGRGHSGLGAADDARPDRARLLVSVEDLADTAVTDSQLTRNDAGPHSGRSHFDNLQPNVVWQRSAIDEDAPELVDPPLSCKHNGGEN